MKILWTTRTAIEEVARVCNCLNNNQLADKLGVSPSVTLNWSRGAIMEKESHIQHAAELMGEDAAWLSLCLAIERVKSAKLANEMRALLLAAVNRAAVVALGLGVLSGGYLGRFGIT